MKAKLLIILSFFINTFSVAQTKPAGTPITEKLYQSLKYRNIGPFRGGRSTCITGVPGNIFTYYMGTTGGGVWKTNDGGTTWDNISDGFFNTTGIGYIAVAPSDPNIIYVGTGEGPVRGVKTSHGDGVYKSTDAGATWTHIGLEATRHISRVFVHPRDPNKVYVAAQGNPYGPNEERGIYLSEEGGKTWKKILYVNENSGIADLSVDASNPNFMMATSWDFNRKPWVVQSGGPGSRVYKTTDGGITWKEINTGLPSLKGKMGVAISGANSKIVYLAIEALGAAGGVYRSDDGGETFHQTTNDPTTFARAWYYMHIIADPKDEDELWVLNSSMMKSIDAGKTFTAIPGSHPDHHALWINPDNSKLLASSNDGGGSISYSGGKTWSTLFNQPTGQFYRVITDNQYPYRIYSGQQDNTTIAINSTSQDQGIGRMHWNELRAGESSTVAFDANNPRFIYSTFFAGNFVEWDSEIDNTRTVSPFPEQVSGEQPKNLKYRANWNGPVLVSPHNPNVIYYGSQFMMKSSDRGVTWNVMSEDLTRNDKEHQGKGGFPISNEQITAESYNNVFNIEESLLKEGVIWVGSDDGLVHVTQNGGKTWTNVTPLGLKEAIINVVEPSPHDAASAYIAVAGYKMNDFTPQIYKTRNYGKSWVKIVNGIPSNTFARSVREDPDRKGLLYAGTETGVFVSFDDGSNWLPLKNNLPEVPITDLRVKRKDLVVSTQGRALWILDDLSPLHQISDKVANSDYYLFKPRDSFAPLASAFSLNEDMGKNPETGMQITYVLNKAVTDKMPMAIEIIDPSGKVVYAESTIGPNTECDTFVKKQLKGTVGAHTWNWNMRVGQFDCIKELTMTNRDLSAYDAAPGKYQVRLTIGSFVQVQDFEIKIDPRIQKSIPGAAAAYVERDQLSASLLTGAMEMSQGVRYLRKIKQQMDIILAEINTKELVNEGKALNDKIESWIEHILQKELRTQQNNYQFEARLLVRHKLLLNEMGDGNVPVTQGTKDVTQNYLEKWQKLKIELKDIITKDIKNYNKLLSGAGFPEFLFSQTENAILKN